QHIEMPSNPYMEFNRYDKQLEHPFVCYADFESAIVWLQTCAPDPSLSYTHKMHIHQPCGYSYVLAGYDGKVRMKRVYRGEDCVTDLFRNLEADYKYVQKIKQICTP